MSKEAFQSPEFAPIAPIRCEKCGKPVRVIVCEMVAFNAATKELRTYQCGSCGNRMTRDVDV
jgi:hypothetical protein